MSNPAFIILSNHSTVWCCFAFSLHINLISMHLLKKKKKNSCNAYQIHTYHIYSVLFFYRSIIVFCGIFVRRVFSSRSNSVHFVGNLNTHEKTFVFNFQYFRLFKCQLFSLKQWETLYKIGNGWTSESNKLADTSTVNNEGTQINVKKNEWKKNNNIKIVMIDRFNGIEQRKKTTKHVHLTHFQYFTNKIIAMKSSYCYYYVGLIKECYTINVWVQNHVIIVEQQHLRVFAQTLSKFQQNEMKIVW